MRNLSVTLTGPEGMLEAMAKLLRDEGYTVRAPGDKRRLVSARALRVLDAIGIISDGQMKRLAKDWRFAELELSRRKAQDKEDLASLAAVAPRLAAGAPYEPDCHTDEALSRAGLGVSYQDPRRPVLVPKAHPGAPKAPATGKSARKPAKKRRRP